MRASFTDLGATHPPDPRRRRVQADNLVLRVLPDRMPWLRVTFLGPFPHSGRVLLEADLYFACADSNSDGFRIVRGDRTLLTLPGEYPTVDPTFNCLDRQRFHPNFSNEWFGTACLGVQGGWAPAIGLPQQIRFYYSLLCALEWDSSSPMPDPTALLAAQVYPRLRREGRLPFDHPQFVLPGLDEEVEALEC